MDGISVENMKFKVSCWNKGRLKRKKSLTWLNDIGKMTAEMYQMVPLSIVKNKWFEMLLVADHCIQKNHMACETLLWFTRQTRSKRCRRVARSQRESGDDVNAGMNTVETVTKKWFETKDDKEIVNMIVRLKKKNGVLVIS